MRMPAAILEAMMPSVTWRGPRESVYLTYDDGPHPLVTPGILDILRSYRVKATFFLLGQNALAHPQLVRRIVEEGHSIGNHSFDHRLLLLRSTDFIDQQLLRTSEAIQGIAGCQTTLFRPPYGYFGPTVLRAARKRQHRVVLWDVDAMDWKPESRSEVVDEICRRTVRGSIVLLHDNVHTVETASDILKNTIDRLQPSFTFSPLH